MARVEDRWIRKDKTRTPLYGKGLRWRAQWTPPAESKQRQIFATKEAAKAFLAEQVSAMNQGTYVRTRTKVLLSDYAEQWKKDQLHHRASSREQVAAKVKLYIIPSLGKMALDSVRREDVQAAVGGLGRVTGTVHRQGDLRVLGAHVQGCRAGGKVQKTPCLSIRLPKIEPEADVPLRTEVVQRLAAEIWRPYRPMVVFCAATGLRSSELLGLTWDRVDFDNSMISIDRQLIGINSSDPTWGPPKTKASRRRIHIGDHSIQILKNLQEGQQSVGGIIFHSAGGRSPGTRRGRRGGTSATLFRAPGRGGTSCGIITPHS